MKAIAQILKSYLHRRIFILLLMLGALYFRIIAGFVLKPHPRVAWCFFLHTSTVVAGIAGFRGAFQRTPVLAGYAQMGEDRN